MSQFIRLDDSEYINLINLDLVFTNLLKAIIQKMN